jgi:hypothetical protein
MVAGAYANSVAIWHTAHEFTLDFLVHAQPPTQVAAPDGTQVIQAPQKLTARVHIPPGVIFDLLRALNENMTKHEEVFGPIKRPGSDTPLYPPEEPG